MPTIEAQLQLEQEMQDRGAESYIKNQRKAEEHGRGSDLDYSRRLMQDYMPTLIQALEDYQNKRLTGFAAGLAYQLLQRIDATKAMFFAMKAVFNSFTIEEPVVATAARIGRMVEDEIRFSRFQSNYKEYYDTVIKDFKNKGTADYRYKHRVMTHVANTKEDGWIAWTQRERVDVGFRLLSIIMENSDLIEKNHTYKRGRSVVTIVATEAAKKWIDSHEDFKKLMFAERAPCIIEPDEWTQIDQGGYYTPVMRRNTPMIKYSGKLQQQLLAKADLSLVMEAINRQMKVAWRVNKRVLEVLRTAWTLDTGVGIPHSEKLEPRECPVPSKAELKEAGKTLTAKQEVQLNEWKREASEVYTMEKERAAQAFQITRIIRMANAYSAYPAFWYVWYADFRGRLYSATAGFSPQGPDAAKGVIEFAVGKPLGPDGLHWLKVHIANRFGYDKATYDGRAKWVDERHDVLMAIADDPTGNLHHWKEADKPYQFLAAVFEYADVHGLVALGHQASEFVSHLPIGLDGSCNGLQNFSAMLRDEVGGRATNLIPAALPADIYSEVADVATKKLRKSTDPMAAEWVAYADELGKGSLPRSLAKRPVMTLPYGATRQSCTKYIFEDIIKNGWVKKFSEGGWKAAVWLCSILWESIGEVVVAARAAMDWLQKTSTAMSRIHKPMLWRTKDGFIATQNSRVIETIQISTQLAGRFQVRIGSFTDKLDANKQRTGISPNFVHSQDATHMRNTIRLAAKHGIYNIACIHDDYGTYAADTGKFQRIIREAFVDMYRDFDPLKQFADIAEAYGAKAPKPPRHGTLDIEQVLESEFFFG